MQFWTEACTLCYGMNSDQISSASFYWMTAGFGPEHWSAARCQHTGTSTVVAQALLAFTDVFPPFWEGNKQDDNQTKQAFELRSLREFWAQSRLLELLKRSHVYKGSNFKSWLGANSKIPENWQAWDISHNTATAAFTCRGKKSYWKWM